MLIMKNFLIVLTQKHLEGGPNSCSEQLPGFKWSEHNCGTVFLLNNHRNYEVFVASSKIEDRIGGRPGISTNFVPIPDSFIPGIQCSN